MPKYTVHFSMVVSTAIEVEANDPDAAVDVAYNSGDMPGSMCYGAFGSASVDESGEWLPSVVTDESGAEVWSEK